MVSGEDGVSIGRLNFLGLGMGLTGEACVCGGHWLLGGTPLLLLHMQTDAAQQVWRVRSC
jgi:hypothetical protein